MTKERLPDPEQYINFVHYQDIDATTSPEDLQNWYRFTNLACLQIEDSKRGKPEEEKMRLEQVRTVGVKVMQRLGKKLRDLGIKPF